jgi:hypothetical protein
MKLKHYPKKKLMIYCWFFLKGLCEKVQFFLPDYEGNAKRLLEPMMQAIDELNGDDAFGSEGWRRGLFGID